MLLIAASFPSWVGVYDFFGPKILLLLFFSNISLLQSISFSFSSVYFFFFTNTIFQKMCLRKWRVYRRKTSSIVYVLPTCIIKKNIATARYNDWINANINKINLVWFQFFTKTKQIELSYTPNSKSVFLKILYKKSLFLFALTANLFFWIYFSEIFLREYYAKSFCKKKKLLWFYLLFLCKLIWNRS